MIDVDVCNKALIKIGADPVLNLSSPGKNAKTCNRIYSQILDAAVSIHPWNFAFKRVILAPLTTTPAFGWDYAFQKPTDCVRILGCGEDWENYPEPYKEEEDGTILANTDTLYLVYIKRVTNHNFFPPYFVEYLAAYLAAELAVPIADDKDLKKSMETEAVIKLSQARFADASAGTPAEVSANIWIDARN